MKQISKIKRIAITTVAVVCALSSVAAISASAKTYTWTHTVSVASVPGSTDSIVATMDKAGRMSDTFSSYPTIFDSYRTSNDKARAVNYTTGKDYGWKSFTLTKDSAAPVTVSYGASLAKGSYYVQYQNVSQGGFRDSSILSKTY